MTESMSAYTERVSQEILPPEKTEVENQIERRQAQGTEEEIVRNLRDNAAAATKVQTELLERAQGCDDRDLPSVLRAVTDLQAKSVEGLLKLTGRAPEQGEGSMAQLLRSLAADGLIRMNVDLEVGPPTEASE